MNFPVSGSMLPWAAVLLGFLFGFLLQRGGVTDYNKIVNQFRFRDFTVLRIMFTAIIVGGIGVLVLRNGGHATLHVKPANMLGVVIGAGLFGVGMVLLGYCPGTGIAAIATGSIHAIAGVLGMLAGGILYALSFPWVQEHIQKAGALGKIRLPEVTGIPDWGWFAILTGIAAVVFVITERVSPSRGTAN